MLLGAPAPLLALSADLAPVLAASAVRGVGFGLLTVADPLGFRAAFGLTALLLVVSAPFTRPRRRVAARSGG